MYFKRRTVSVSTSSIEETKVFRTRKVSASIPSLLLSLFSSKSFELDWHSSIYLFSNSVNWLFDDLKLCAFRRWGTRVQRTRTLFIIRIVSLLPVSQDLPRWPWEGISEDAQRSSINPTTLQIDPLWAMEEIRLQNSIVCFKFYSHLEKTEFYFSSLRRHSFLWIKIIYGN